MGAEEQGRRGQDGKAQDGKIQDGKAQDRKVQVGKDQCENVTYLLRCADGTLYCGWTNHLGRRLEAHNAGKGAKYTKSRRPVELVYHEVFATKREAMVREAAIKKLSRKEKERLIRG